MQGSLDEVDDVLAVAHAEEELRSAGFHRNVAVFFDPRLSAEEFRSGVRRSILQAWVDAQGARVPVLQRFDGRRQDTLVQEFRSLEKRFLRSGPARILDRVGDRTTDGNGGEVGLIRREAAKRRKHIPLRKLFAQAYTVIPRLKPCLLMSPLSVAQFLKDSPSSRPAPRSCRRRCSGLIAFSNARFYESRLVTFPSANDAESEMGVRWVPVPDGVYDRGRSRTNAREAERIAELVVEHWRNRPEESLGVVTLSQAQMDRVDDVLQERIRKEPDLEDFYMQEGDERFFGTTSSWGSDTARTPAES